MVFQSILVLNRNLPSHRSRRIVQPSSPVLADSVVTRSFVSDDGGRFTESHLRLMIGEHNTFSSRRRSPLSDDTLLTPAPSARNCPGVAQPGRSIKEP